MARIRQSTLVGAAIAAIIAGCVSSCTIRDGGDCVPGMSVECACAAGLRGVQTCRADHTYDRCTCGADAGADDGDARGMHDGTDVLRGADSMLDIVQSEMPPGDAGSESEFDSPSETADVPGGADSMLDIVRSEIALTDAGSEHAFDSPSDTRVDVPIGPESGGDGGGDGGPPPLVCDGSMGVMCAYGALLRDSAGGCYYRWTIEFPHFWLGPDRFGGGDPIGWMYSDSAGLHRLYNSTVSSPLYFANSTHTVYQNNPNPPPSDFGTARVCGSTMTFTANGGRGSLLPPCIGTLPAPGTGSQWIAICCGSTTLSLADGGASLSTSCDAGRDAASAD